MLSSNSGFLESAWPQHIDQPRSASAATATLLIGPLSFVGLMAQHIARTLGFQRALPHMIAAALAGAAITTYADFIGRVALFPNQLPVGIVATLIGGSYFLWLLRKQVN